MTQAERIRALVRMAAQAQAVVDDEAMDWEAKYDFIFSPEFSVYIRDTLGFRLDYYDPDTSYEEDVRAYVTALREKADQQAEVLKHLEGDEE